MAAASASAAPRALFLVGHRHRSSSSAAGTASIPLPPHHRARESCMPGALATLRLSPPPQSPSYLPLPMTGRRWGIGSKRTASSSAAFRCFSALTPDLRSSLDKVVASHKVVLFMKGTREFPQCGFSNTVVQMLKSLNVPFETLDILENDLLRQALKEYSNWPTFPQLYIDGEFFGGCDITLEAYKSGELQELLEKAMCS